MIRREPTQQMLAELAEQKVIVRQDLGANYITIAGAPYRIIDGEDFPEVKAASIGRAIRGREISLYDPDSPVLAKLVEELVTEIYGTFDVSYILENVLRFVRKRFPSSKTDLFASRWNGKVDSTSANGVIDFAEFIQQKAGWCRHHAILVNHLVKALIKKKILPEGKVHNVRSNIQGSGGHTWAIYRPYHQKPMDIYWLDSMRFDTAFLLKKNQALLIGHYGEEAYNKCLYRYYGSWVPGPDMGFSYDISTTPQSCTYKEAKESKGTRFVHDRDLGAGSFGKAMLMTGGGESYVVKRFTYKDRAFSVNTADATAVERAKEIIRSAMRAEYIDTAREAQIHWGVNKIGSSYTLPEPITMRIEGGKVVVATAPTLFIFEKFEPGTIYHEFKPVSARQYIKMAIATFEAVEKIHRVCFHLDIHESNVSVEVKGEDVVVHIFDFTLSKYPGEQLERVNNLVLTIKPPEYKDVTSILAAASQDVWCIDRLLGLTLNESLFTPATLAHIRRVRAGMGAVVPASRMTLAEGLQNYKAVFVRLLIDEITLKTPPERANALLKEVKELNEPWMRKQLLEGFSVEQVIAGIGHHEFSALPPPIQSEFFQILFEAKKRTLESDFKDSAIDKWCFLMDLRHMLHTPGRMREAKKSTEEVLKEGFAQYDTLQASTTFLASAMNNFVKICFEEDEFFLTQIKALSQSNREQLIRRLIAQENSRFLHESIKNPKLFFSILSLLFSAELKKVALQNLSLFFQRAFRGKKTPDRFEGLLILLNQSDVESRSAILNNLSEWIKEFVRLPDFATRFKMTYPVLINTIMAFYLRQNTLTLPEDLSKTDALDKWCAHIAYAEQLEADIRGEVKFTDDSCVIIHAEVMDDKATLTPQKGAGALAKLIAKDQVFSNFYRQLKQIQDVVKIEIILLYLKGKESLWVLLNRRAELFTQLFALIPPDHYELFSTDLPFYLPYKIQQAPAEKKVKEFFSALHFLKSPEDQENFLKHPAVELLTVARSENFFTELNNVPINLRWCILHRIYELLNHEQATLNLAKPENIDKICYVIRFIFELEKNRNDPQVCNFAKAGLQSRMFSPYPWDMQAKPGLERLIAHAADSPENLFKVLHQYLQPKQIKPFLAYIESHFKILIGKPSFDECFARANPLIQHEVLLAMQKDHPRKVVDTLKMAILLRSPTEQLTVLLDRLNIFSEPIKSELLASFSLDQWQVMLSSSNAIEQLRKSTISSVNELVLYLSSRKQNELLRHFPFKEAMDKWLACAQLTLICKVNLEGEVKSSDDIHVLAIRTLQEVADEKTIWAPTKGRDEFLRFIMNDKTIEAFIQQVKGVGAICRKDLLLHLCGDDKTYLWKICHNKPQLFRDLFHLLAPEDRIFFTSHLVAYVLNQPQEFFHFISSDSSKELRKEFLLNLPSHASIVSHPNFMTQLKTAPLFVQQEVLLYLYDKMQSEFARGFPDSKAIDGFCYVTRFSYQLQKNPEDAQTCGFALAGLEQRLLNSAKPWGTLDPNFGLKPGLFRLKENVLVTTNPETPGDLIAILGKLEPIQMKPFLAHLETHFDEMAKQSTFKVALSQASLLIKKEVLEFIFLSRKAELFQLFTLSELRSLLFNYRIGSPAVELNADVVLSDELISYVLKQARIQVESQFPLESAIDRWCASTAVINQLEKGEQVSSSKPERKEVESPRRLGRDVFLSMTDEKATWETQRGFTQMIADIEELKMAAPFLRNLSALPVAKIAPVLEYLKPQIISIVRQPDFFHALNGLPTMKKEMLAFLSKPEMVLQVWEFVPENQKNEFSINWLEAEQNRMLEIKGVAPTILWDKWYYCEQQIAELKENTPNCILHASRGFATLACEWKLDTGVSSYKAKLTMAKLIDGLKKPFPPDKMYLLNKIGLDDLKQLITGFDEEKQTPGQLPPAQHRFFTLLRFVPEGQKNDFLRLLGPQFVASLSQGLPFIYYKTLVEQMTSAFGEKSPEVEKVHTNFAKQLFDANSKSYKKALGDAERWMNDPLYKNIWCELAHIYYGKRRNSAKNNFYYKKAAELSACEKIMDGVKLDSVPKLEPDEADAIRRGELAELVTALKKTGVVRF